MGESLQALGLESDWLLTVEVDAIRNKGAGRNREPSGLIAFRYLRITTDVEAIKAALPICKFDHNPMDDAEKEATLDKKLRL